MSLLDEIPGYREAVERESAARAEAFTDAPEIVCGVELLPLTPRRLLVLEAIRSPFAVGGPVAPRDVALFLWSLSPEYAAAFNVRRSVYPWLPRVADMLLRLQQIRLLRKVRHIDFAEALQGCRVYMSNAMADGPGNKDTPWTPEYYSSCASLVVMFAQQFGWSQEEILNTPFRRLYQYNRCTRDRTEKRAIFFNPSDSVRSNWIRENTHTN